VLGGITIVLYGMIGLLGAKIWKENRVDFGNPINLVPIAAGIILAIANVDLKFTDHFSLGGIALGTIVAIAGYHLARVIAPPHLKAELASGERPELTAEEAPVLGAGAAPVVEDEIARDEAAADSPVLVVDEPGKAAKE